MFFNKKILLLGGGEFDQDFSLYDYVVALNNNPPFQDTCSNLVRITTGEAKEINDITFIFKEYKGTSEFIGNRDQFKFKNPHGAAYEWANILRKQIGGTNPLMGTVALEFLRHQSPSEIFVDGINFYHSKDLVRTKPIAFGSHNIINDINYFKLIKKIDSRVFYSELLNKVLDLY